MKIDIIKVLCHDFAVRSSHFISEYLRLFGLMKPIAYRRTMNRILWYVLLGVIVESSQVARIREDKICIGTNGRMSGPSIRGHHYRNLRDRYMNCTYVDGNLELTWLQDKSFDLSFLQHIREVTGYVLISHVDINRVVLPSLQIIRGRTLFRLPVHDMEFALIVTLSKMNTLEMPMLSDIIHGSVGILNNYNLCHIRTIQWLEIIDSSAEELFVYDFSEPERTCPPCHESCSEGCWGEGPENCQKFSRLTCSPQCHGGRCFGNKPRECCHLFCAGGCTGPKQSDCLACNNFFDDGVCKHECPPMQRYNSIKYRWEKNPHGKYAYGATCVKDCPPHLLKDNGACVRVCPPKKKTLNGECVPCEGPCPKTCHFSGTVHSGNIESFRNCTIIEGSIIILDTTFSGFQQIYDNFTFGPFYRAMLPAKLEVFSTLKEVTGFLNVQADHEDFTTLNAFRNLQVIGGRTLTEYFSALYVVKTSLVSLNLRSLKTIRSGSVAILENPKLCYATTFNWSKLMKSNQHNTLLVSNGNAGQCFQNDHVCDSRCSSDGCWGPGSKLCYACKTYQVEQECVEHCDAKDGLFQIESECKRCDPQCELTCVGPGPGNCHRCKHAKDGPFCVEKCPDGKYLEPLTGECFPCHSNCVEGCKGPENNIGPRGCHSCDKGIMNTDKVLVQCLMKDDDCPDDTYNEWISHNPDINLKLLKGMHICRPCHPFCQKCTGYGFHKNVCSVCANVLEGEQCKTECSADYFIDEVGRTCQPCAKECHGCVGTSVSDCISCKNYKIYTSSTNSSDFMCTETCPSEYPHKIFPQDDSDPFCSVDSVLGLPLRSQPSLIAIIGGIVGCIVLLGLFLSVFGFQWRQRARSKENTAKMTMAMTGYEDSEPLRPTNIRPNLAKLKIVREAELRKGGILGYGAFGTVYKGVWIPDGENVKIPVAVKVLREGSGSNTSKDILEEAYIMASVEHQNLLQLLAVCMTSQMMLVTQLMPLGCLLDYVRNNKEKIGSKPLLNWCTQIARGMMYLEERRLVHRDLAARNVLVQTPSCVKITDFGLAKLLDINEDEYKAAGGKMPIKWLALECINQRVFTHKSDVWAFGVTVWELLTYGGRPYEVTPAREVPDLLEKGERLEQPSICTIDVYMILIKCWMVEPDSRPSFKELAEQFSKMARDPGRFLVIPGDKLMRLPTYTTQDEKELIHNLSRHIGGAEVLVAAEDYFNPGRVSSQHSLITPADTPLPCTPTQKFFPSNMFPPPAYDDAIGRPKSKVFGSTGGVNEAGIFGSLSLRYGSSFFSQSCDPLKLLEDDNIVNGSHPMGCASKFHGTASSGTMDKAALRSAKIAGLKIELPLDDEDYLMPLPPFLQHNSPPKTSNSYMDLGSEPKCGVSNSVFQYPVTSLDPSGDKHHPNRGFLSLDNPEYHMQSDTKITQNQGDYHTLGIPFSNGGSPRSPGPSSIQSVPNGGTTISSVISSHSTINGRPFSSLSNGAGPIKTVFYTPDSTFGVSTSNAACTLPGNSMRSHYYVPHDYYNDIDKMKHGRNNNYTDLSPGMSITTVPPLSRNETTV